MSANQLYAAATPEEQQQIRDAAKIALARKNFLAFASYIDPSYQTPPHIKMLCEYLNKVVSGEITRLAVTMPPRHGKSATTSCKLPAFVIGQDDKRCVILLGHSAGLAETFSIENRDTIAHNPRWRQVFPNVALNPSRRGAGIWAVNQARENMVACGMLGGLVGYGAWLVIIDDPIRTSEEAHSVTYREKVWRQYKAAARTRLTPDGRIIIMMTRWHEDDLVGKILASPEGNEWTVLHLPALSYGSKVDYAHLNKVEYKRVIRRIPTHAFPDPLDRPKDVPLWPERFDKEFLDNQQVGLEEDFDALYQGSPGGIQGKKFKRQWFRGITGEAISQMKVKVEARARSYDLAWAETERSDDTVGLRATLYSWNPEVVEQLEDRGMQDYLRFLDIPPVFMVIEDVTWWKEEWDVSNEKIISLAVKDTDKYGLLVEAVAAQSIGFKALKRDIRLTGYGIQKAFIKGDKEVRAKPALALGNKKFFYFLYPRPHDPPEWEDYTLQTLCNFPHAKHDDAVDAFTQLVGKWQPLITKLLKGLALPKAKTVEAQKGLSIRETIPEFRVQPHRWQRDRLGWC